MMTHKILLLAIYYYDNERIRTQKLNINYTVSPEKVVQCIFLSIYLTLIVIFKLFLCSYIVLLSYVSKIPYIAILYAYLV